eukprot:6368539-Prymnesium_polylepis.1
MKKKKKKSLLLLLLFSNKQTTQYAPPEPSTPTFAHTTHNLQRLRRLCLLPRPSLPQKHPRHTWQDMNMDMGHGHSNSAYQSRAVPSCAAQPCRWRSSPATISSAAPPSGW